MKHESCSLLDSSIVLDIASVNLGYVPSDQIKPSEQQRYMCIAHEKR